MCALSVDDCDVLAGYLKDHGEPDQAAKVYQRWVDEARDRVGVSNDVKWLANYYLDRGEKAKALALGQMAAGVYSASGLETMAAVLEKTGRRVKAEEYFRKIDERYDHPGLLVEFLMRHREEPRFAQSLEHLIKEIFPGGSQPVQDGTIGKERPEGVAISSVPKNAAPAAFNIGDVVVGVDGLRVRSLRQFRVQWRLSVVADTQLHFWRGGSVQEVKMPRKAIRDYGFAADPPRH